MQEERDTAVVSLEAQKKAAADSYNAQIKLLEDKSAIQNPCYNSRKYTVPSSFSFPDTANTGTSSLTANFLI